MAVRGRLHQLPLRDGSVIALISRGAIDPEMDDNWELPDLGKRITVYQHKKEGKFYCFGIVNTWWHTVRGEWELINPEVIPSVEEML